MSRKRYVVELAEEERSSLRALVEKGKVAAHKRRHAQVLLKADAGEHGPGWSDERVGEAVDVHANTVKSVRKRFVEEAQLFLGARIDESLTDSVLQLRLGGK